MAAKRRSAGKAARQLRGATAALAQAGRNATAATRLAQASAQVIAARMALGAAGASDPARADYVELARILPEKMSAGALSAMASAAPFAALWQRSGTFAFSEAMAVSKATMAMATARTMGGLAAAQTAYAQAAFQRATAQSLGFAAAMLRWQQAATAPFLRAAAANARRLG